MQGQNKVQKFENSRKKAKQNSEWTRGQQDKRTGRKPRSNRQDVVELELY